MAQAFEIIQPSTIQTLIEFVIDETGSMQSCRDATISGFNEYISGQKLQPGDCFLTLTKFDSSGVRNVYTDTPIALVPDLNRDTYKPNSSTNLYDAIGARIIAVENRLPLFTNKPNILMVIMTDGEDNCSREFNPDMLKGMIKSKESEGWTFVFMGANQDAWTVGQTFGMAKGNTMTYSTANMSATMTSLSASTSGYRSARASGAVESTTSSNDFFSGVTPEVK